MTVHVSPRSNGHVDLAKLKAYVSLDHYNALITWPQSRRGQGQGIFLNLCILSLIPWIILWTLINHWKEEPKHKKRNLCTCFPWTYSKTKSHKIIVTVSLASATKLLQKFFCVTKLLYVHFHHISCVIILDYCIIWSLQFLLASTHATTLF